jgi:SAM-dependent methyltransferase
MAKAVRRSQGVAGLYDWLSRFTRLRDVLRFGARNSALSMHKTLRISGELAQGDRNEAILYIDDRAAEAAALPPDPQVLDAGCGFGGTIFRWHDLIGGQYDGLTLSRVQQRIAQREASRRGLGAQCRFHLRSYDEPITATYDAVIAIESLIHSPDFDHTIANLAAALKPGGKLVVADDIPGCDLEQDEDALRLKQCWRLSTIPSAEMYQGAISRNRLRIVHNADYTGCVVTRSLAGLRRLEGIYRAVHIALPFDGPRSVSAAFLGGLALERLYLSGRVRYQLLVIKKEQ